MHGSFIYCMFAADHHGPGQARHRSRCWERREEGVQQTRFFPRALLVFHKERKINVSTEP